MVPVIIGFSYDILGLRYHTVVIVVLGHGYDIIIVAEYDIVALLWL